MEGRKRTLRRRMVYVGIVVLTAALNVAAWNSTAFCDWYIAHVFPIWVNTYGRLTGVFPFSVGEGMLAAGVAVALFAVVLGIVWAGIGIWTAASKLGRMCFGGAGRRADRTGERSAPAAGLSGDGTGVSAAESKSGAGNSAAEQGLKKGVSAAEEGLEAEAPGRGKLRGFRRFSGGFGYFFAWTLLAVCLIMTLNCFILYHASTFSEQYFGEEQGDYALTELIEVYNLAAEQCNRLAGMIERDADGMAVYRGSAAEKGDADMGFEEAGRLLDMEDRARKLMLRLGRTYPQLDGYYPRPKALLSSDFMCQQHMQGYYFPFSMEANYNDVMHILNIPATMCHELAHLRGYIYEDEANFIAYLACVQSEDVFFQYAGYLSVLVYLNNDLYKAWKEERSAYEEAVKIIRPVAVDDRVWEDNLFVTEEEWERINGKALIDTEIVDRAADIFIDTNLKVNGIPDGRISYSRVVRLLLQYYRKMGFEKII